MRPKRTKRPVKTTLGTAPRDEGPVDESILQKPMVTSVFGLRQVLTLFTTATDEVKEYVTMECDVLYECRICRALFRSLANFVLHKRKYCTERYSACKRGWDVFDETPEAAATPPSPSSHDSPLDSIVRRLKEKHDIDRLIDETKDEDLSGDGDTKSTTAKPSSVEPERIGGNEHAVFQSGMKSEVMEICDILDNNEAIIGPDGKWRSGSERPMRCKECGQAFSTRKTLTYHVKYKHNGSRLVYVCPDCGETYANAWSVYRHLFKVHRKTMAQIRKLRSQICNNAVRRDEEPTRVRKEAAEPDAPENGDGDSENQWLADIETDSYFQMCGGCGKRFERKAALQSHTHTCLKRQQVCQSIQNNSNNRRRAQEENNNVNGGKQEEEQQPKRTSRKKGSARRKPEESTRRRTKRTTEAAPPVDHNANRNDDDDDALDGLGKDEVFDIIGYRGCEGRPAPPPPPPPPPPPQPVTTFDRFDATPDRLLRRSFPYIDTRALTCLGCRRAPEPFATLADLLRHMSHHFRWHRFQCLRCSYVSYDQSECEAHCAGAHQLTIAAVLPLPQWKSEMEARKRCGRIVGAGGPLGCEGYDDEPVEEDDYDDDLDEEEEEEELEEEEREEREPAAPPPAPPPRPPAVPSPEVIVIEDAESDEEPSSGLFWDSPPPGGAADPCPPPPSPPETTTDYGDDAAIDLDFDDDVDRHTVELPTYHYIEPCRYDSPAPADMKRDDFVQDCCSDDSWEQPAPAEPEVSTEPSPPPPPPPPNRPKRTVKRSTKVCFEDFEYDLDVLTRASRCATVVRQKKAKRPKKTD